MRFLAVLLFPLMTFAATQDAPEWMLTDLRGSPELAAFFAGADAVITVKKKNGEDGEAVRPTIFVFHLDAKPKSKLKTSTEWGSIVKSFIQDKQKLVLREDVSQTGKYLIEFTSRHRDTKTDLRSVYLAMQAADNTITLFIYDGIGPATAKNLPVVRSFLKDLEFYRLDDMYGADQERRKNSGAGQAI